MINFLKNLAEKTATSPSQQVVAATHRWKGLAEVTHSLVNCWGPSPRSKEDETPPQV